MARRYDIVFPGVRERGESANTEEEDAGQFDMTLPALAFQAIPTEEPDEQESPGLSLFINILLFVFTYNVRTYEDTVLQLVLFNVRSRALFVVVWS